MQYIIRWTKPDTPFYLASLEAYETGTQKDVAWRKDPAEAVRFDDFTALLAGIQQRALNINDINSFLEIVPVEISVSVELGETL